MKGFLEKVKYRFEHIRKREGFQTDRLRRKMKNKEETNNADFQVLNWDFDV
jgi:cytidylate kinase